MNRNFLISMVLGFGLTFMNMAPVQAASISDLQEVDFLADGDGLLTLDKSTGLLWLDLSVTAGNSILDTEAELFFTMFRWATAEEIADLLDAALPGYGYRESYDVQDLNNAQALIDLLSPSVSGFSPVSYGTSRYLNGYAPGLYSHSYVQVTPFISETRVNDLVTGVGFDESYKPSYQFTGMGSWLVVPEPAAIALLAAGLSCLGLLRRKSA